MERDKIYELISSGTRAVARQDLGHSARLWFGHQGRCWLLELMQGEPPARLAPMAGGEDLPLAITEWLEEPVDQALVLRARKTLEAAEGALRDLARGRCLEQVLNQEQDGSRHRSPTACSTGPRPR